MTPVVESARPMRLQGRVAVVTGGGRGIGLGCARAFASEGARVFIAEIDPDLGRQAESVLREGGADATAVPCDVGDPDQVAEMVRSIVARTGRIDICLNNAGISRRNHVFDVTEAEFEAIMRVNLRGVFLVSQAVARAMVAAGSGGSIINMGSIVGVLAVPQQPVYCVTKQGVDGLTRVFSLALGASGSTPSHRGRFTRRCRNRSTSIRRTGIGGFGRARRWVASARPRTSPVLRCFWQAMSPTTSRAKRSASTAVVSRSIT
jgi:NADP-dependent 3-hydroxy acid dehydrogenase YdfG